jgi:hypothetical protein
VNAAGIAKTLTKSGQAMTLTRTDSAFDPVTGGASASVVDEWTVYGVTANYSWKESGSAANNAGSLIQSGDKKAIIQAFSDEYGDEVEPKPGDTLTIMGVEWTVIAVESLNPQGVNLLYTCQVRR